MSVRRKDTTEAIWDDLYLVSIPDIYSRPDEDIKRFGTRITGDKLFDSGATGDFKTVMINIDKMIEHFRNNLEIRIVNYSDTKNIYEAISDHLHAWMYQIKHGINIGDAPIEDLILMDQFAEHVFGHAVQFYDDENNCSDLMRFLDPFTKSNPLGSVFKVDNTTGKKYESEAPKRDKMTDFLVNNWR